MPRPQHAAPDPIDVAVGARMRMRRKTLGLTQTALAEALGITFQQVQKYERGANRVSASMLVRAAKRLDCPVAFLVGEEPGGFPTDETLLTMLAYPGAIDLLHAYTSIDDAGSRNAVVTVARALSGQEARRSVESDSVVQPGADQTVGPQNDNTDNQEAGDHVVDPANLAAE